MKNNQNILKRLENLMQPESTVLKAINSKKNKNNDIIAKKEKGITEKKEKISGLNNEITTLKNTSSLVKSSLNMLKDKDLKVLISVLKLSINPQGDLDKITNQLPLQISIREQNIKDLENSIKEDTDKVNSCKNENNNLSKEYESALKYQEDLHSLIKEATLGTVNKTRLEVVTILKNASFTDEEATDIAKMVMFPEDELRPYFAKFKFDKPKIKEEEVNLDKLNIKEEPKKEEQKLEEKIEDNTPISFEELKNMILEDTKEEETPISIDSLKSEEPKVEDSPISIEPISLDEISFDKEEVKNEEIKEVNIDDVLKEYNVSMSDLPKYIDANNITNYLENITILKKEGYKIEDDELNKFGISLTLYGKDNTVGILKVLKDYNVSLVLPNSHHAIRLFSITPTALIHKLDLLLEVGELSLAKYYANNLTNNIEDIVERILFCRKYNIPYKEERTNEVAYRPFIFSQSSLEKLVEKEVTLELLPKYNENLSNLNKKAIAILDSNKELLSTKLKGAAKFDEFNKLETLLESKGVCKDNAYIINNVSFSYQNTKRNLMCLVNSDCDVDTKDLILASLFYNTNKSVEDFNSIKEGWEN